MRFTSTLIPIVALLLLLFPACGRSQSPHQLTVFAAASLTEVFGEAGPRFEHAHPGVSVVFNFGGSQRLLSQLQLGARADLFAAASPTELDAARAGHLLSGDRVVLAHNKLVIIVPAANPASIATPGDIARPGLKLALAMAAVPVGSYSRASLAKLATAPGIGPDFSTRVLANVVTEEDDVKQVVAKVLLGEVDAGITYVTDARAAGLGTLAIPDQYNEIATYAISGITGGTEPGVARGFIDYLLSPEGQQLLVKYGFLPVQP